MDIHSRSKYPSNSLSNFSPHPFEIDGIKCNSMEGFLQSLKFKSPEMQIEICKLVGLGAKKRGAGKNWYVTQTLWWKGNPIKRDSDEYQDLLNKAYIALNKNTKFNKALKSTNNAVLTHSIGKSKPSETILTKKEFCSRLTKLRDGIPLENLKPKKLF